VVLDPLSGAAAGFALQLADKKWRDWLKRRRLAAAYRTAANATIEHCRNEGYPVGSDIWNTVTTLLRTETRAQKVASWYARQTIDSTEFQGMIGNAPIVRQFLEHFISLLNQQRLGLLPLDLQTLTDILNTRFTQVDNHLDEVRDELVDEIRQIERSTPDGQGIHYWMGRFDTIGQGFIGRDEALEALGKGIKDRRVAIISGGAGSGKSRLATEYAHQSQTDGFWTTAGVDVAATMAALAPALGIEISNRTDDEVAEEVGKVLASVPSDTLWVIDNLERLEQVNSLLNAVSIPLLVTTRDDRRQILPSNAAAFQQLPVLHPAPAIELLLSRSESDTNDPALLQIAELVGYLPLALEMLAIRLGEFIQTPDKVLEQLRTVPTPIQLAKFQEVGGTTIDRIEGVFNTITGTLENLSEDVRAQISPLGYIADAPIPGAFLSALTGIEDEELSTVIEECRLRSVVSIVDDQVVIHALTIATIAATNPEGILATTLNRAGERLASIIQNHHAALRTEITHHERILSESRKAFEPEVHRVASFAGNLASGYSELGRYGEAVRLDEETLSIMERVLGPEHPDTLSSRNNLAGGYRALGRYEEAVRLTEETLSIRERVLGPEHPDTLSSRNNVAIGYRTLGRYEDAVRLDEETLPIMERVLGPEHPDTFASRNNLAIGYHSLGRYGEAVRLFEETLRIREQVLGPEHPNTLASRNNLAGGYRALGRYEEAVRLDEEALSIRERVLGPEHPDTLNSRNNLANGYRALGRYEEAVRLDEETLSIRERVLGPEHPDTLYSRGNLANGYRALGRYEEAVRLYEETLSIMERVLGPEHPDTLNSRSNLAQAYRAIGRNTEADELDMR